MSKANAGGKSSAEIRRGLDHPVIDSDAHIIEVQPVLIDYLKQVAGTRIAGRYEHMMTEGGGPWGWYAQSVEERYDRHTMRPPFWTIPAGNSKDRMTGMLPRLMRSRLDEFGIDFAIVYTSIGLPFVSHDDDELRQSVCRALNTMYADLYSDQQDRMTPAAVVPMHTPEEALRELNYAVEELGYKTVMIAGGVKRPVPVVAREAPEYAQYATWIDSLAVDSAYDYDPVWRRFVELGVAAASHNNSMGWGARSTVSNYMYNHIGQFGAAGEAFSKALFFGGVMKRYPTLRMAFLEGGVGWASNMYGEIIEHWEKRNLTALKQNLDPARVDTDIVKKLASEYGGAMADRIPLQQDLISTGKPVGEDPNFIDDFGACGVEKPEDIKTLFVDRFYFGCEADDRMVALAFNRSINHYGATLKAMFSSDIGHWDVTNMADVLGQAHGLVEEGLLDDNDFRAFTFGNVAELHSGMNPEFFKGTVVEDAVSEWTANAPGLSEQVRVEAREPEPVK